MSETHAQLKVVEDASKSDDALFAAQDIKRLVLESRKWLKQQQNPDGHWVFELEADATIPAEYIILNHFLGTPNAEAEIKIAGYLRRTQSQDHGGWPLYYDGDFNISASVKAYYALKMAGDDINAPHMVTARNAIIGYGGAARANVFTRIMLALFEQVPWRAVPVIRVETMLLPKWSIFHIDKVSYWSRTVMVPLFVLATLKPKAANPSKVDISELFVVPPDLEKNYMINPSGHWIGAALLKVDWLLRFIEPVLPNFFAQKATRKAMAFVRERLNGEDGLGAIFPAMANAVMAFHVLGTPADDPAYITARKAIDRLLVFKDGIAYCQPCVSPVWDTSLALHALLESGLEDDNHSVEKGLNWLADRQILDAVGDWSSKAPNLRPGGWAFQYNNDFYPDVDDTAVVVMALHRANPGKYEHSIQRGAEWIVGMQSKNGGWGAFDVDNDHTFLQHIPFADHGALLDPPTSDVTARCLGMLAQLDPLKYINEINRAITYLKNEQEPNGSWFGRWGNNYVYGTWSVLCALNAAGIDMQSPFVERAVDWLKGRQCDDGGWGEDCASYWQNRRDEVKVSTPSQTSWAVLALMAAGEIDSISVKGGIDYLLNAPRENGHWSENYFNAVGFPRVFYLRYYGYSAFFPLWTLARYNNLKNSREKFPKVGL